MSEGKQRQGLQSGPPATFPCFFKESGLPALLPAAPPAVPALFPALAPAPLGDSGFLSPVAGSPDYKARHQRASKRGRLVGMARSLLFESLFDGLLLVLGHFLVTILPLLGYVFAYSPSLGFIEPPNSSLSRGKEKAYTTITERSGRN